MDTKKISSSEVRDIIANVLKTTKAPRGEFKKISIKVRNWYSGGNIWCNTELIIGGGSEPAAKYDIRDKCVTESQIVSILNFVVKSNNLNVFVDCQKYEPYFGPVEYTLKGVYVLGAPCAEFVKLQKLIQKRTGKLIGITDIWTDYVVGKRSSWSGMYRGFLAYQPRYCTKFFDELNNVGTARDVFKMEIKEEMIRDEYEYNYAQRCESEWYGSNANHAVISVTTPTGRSKGKIDIMCSSLR